VLSVPGGAPEVRVGVSEAGRSIRANLSGSVTRSVSEY
jgi:hypothetical protein